MITFLKRGPNSSILQCKFSKICYLFAIKTCVFLYSSLHFSTNDNAISFGFLFLLFVIDFLVKTLWGYGCTSIDAEPDVTGLEPTTTTSCILQVHYMRIRAKSCEKNCIQTRVTRLHSLIKNAGLADWLPTTTVYCHWC